MFTPQCSPDLAALSRRTVEGEIAVPSYGRKRDLRRHVEMLEREFVGRSQLALFHAATIVFIRRDINRETCVARFELMWRDHIDHLLGELDSRWLISACDTIVDTSTDAHERSVAALSALFANTIKLYETERMVTGRSELDEQLTELSEYRPLYDGMSAFLVGRGEMVAQQMRRLRDGLEPARVSTRILHTLIDRACEGDTVFRRLREVHRNPDTAW